MIKNYNQFINEDLRSKTIITPKEFTIDNLKREYPSLNINVTDFNVIISSDNELELNNEFYKTLKKDNINKDDIIFENCEEIILYDINGFTKVSDYGKFGEGINDFNCASCINLTSLDGTPETIGCDFNCCNCEITSLKFAPQKVGSSFYCDRCTNLTSLEGVPKHVIGDFYCTGCVNLTSLEGAPNFIGNYFYCKKCDENFIKLAIEKYGFRVKS